MGFKCGIVGLPNVGKSTLFNALTASKNAQAANFPFCTIDPNIGVVDVPDERLDQLSKLSNSKRKIFTNITFVDIAGLVKGASKGEGLGNKFLSHIREVDAIIHLVRCFDSSEITHVNSEINPLSDLETIKTEILLSSLTPQLLQIKSANPKVKVHLRGDARLNYGAIAVVAGEIRNAGIQVIALRTDLASLKNEIEAFPVNIAKPKSANTGG